MDSSISASGDTAPIPLRPDQIEQAAGMLARAFQEGVLASFIFPDVQRRRQHLPAAFAQVLRDALRDGEVFALGPTLAVAVWIPPRATSTPELGMAEDAKAAWLDATRAWSVDERERFERFAGHTEAVRARLMPDPHAYLLTIGVEPSHHGRGLGSSLMAPQLARFTAEGVPCFLVTGLVRNVRFYERHGFRVLEESVVPDSSFRIWAMRRD
jgi:ribosomal protein S18 acetylase RimI-like enzyme